MTEIKDYYVNGKLYHHCWINEKGNLEGEYKQWYENGQIWQHCFFKNGLLQGEYKDWHSGGQLAEHCFYRDDKKADISEQVADVNNITEHEYFLLQITFGYFPILKFDGKL